MQPRLSFVCEIQRAVLVEMLVVAALEAFGVGIAQCFGHIA